MEICTSHYNEDLEWLKKSPWPVSIVHHEGGTPIDCTYLIPNFGFEVTSYFKYIIERYDSLPEHVAFIHGHETAHHQLGDRPMLDMIRDANVKKYDYIPLNNSWRCVESTLQCEEETAFAKNNNFPEMPEYFITCSGGQFIVSKKAILGHAKSAYQYWYSLANSKHSAIYFELSWHSIFGRADSIVPYIDHFEPSLKEVLYSSAAFFPMLIFKFKACFIGESTNLLIINITNQEEYDYYSNRGGSFFTDGKCLERINFKVDLNKIGDIKYINTIRGTILKFQNIAFTLSSIDNQLHF